MEIFYALLAIFAVVSALQIWGKFRKLRTEDQQRAKDMARMNTGQSRNVARKVPQTLAASSITQKRSFWGQVFQGISPFRPHMDDAVDRQYRLAQKLNQPEALVHTSAHDSAARLVKGIANHNPVVLFMNGKATTTTDKMAQLLYDVLATLEVTVKDVDVPADPEMPLGLPQRDGKADLPYLYIGGSAIGGAAQVLAMAQSGALQEVLAEAKIAHNADAARTLITGPSNDTD